MLRRTVFAVLAVALLTAALSSSAGAANWRSNYGVNYPHAISTGFWRTSPVSSKLTWGSSPAAVITCTLQADGWLTGPGSSTGAVGPSVGTWQVSSIELGFTGCTGVSGVTVTIVCGSGLSGGSPGTVLTGTAPGGYNGGTQTSYSGAASKITTANVGIACEVRFNGALCKTLAGGFDITYQNPSVVGGTLNPLNITGLPSAGTLNVTTTGSMFTVGGPICFGVPLVLTASLTTPAGTPLSFSIPTIAPADTPIIWYGTL